MHTIRFVMPQALATMLAHDTKVLKSPRAVDAPQSRPPSLAEDNDTTGHRRTSRGCQFLCLGVNIGTVCHVGAVLCHGIGGV